MKSKFHTPSQPFLMELIVVIFFFAFASVISLQVFVKASNLSQEAVALEKSMIQIQSAAERDRTLSQEDLAGTLRARYFDENWTETNQANASYTLVTQIDKSSRPAGTMVSFHYKMTKSDITIYELDTKKYYPSSALSVEGGDLHE